MVDEGAIKWEIKRRWRSGDETEISVLETFIVRHLQNSKERWLADVWIFQSEIQGKGHGWGHNLGIQHTEVAKHIKLMRSLKRACVEGEEMRARKKYWGTTKLRDSDKKDVCQGGQKWQQEKRIKMVPSPRSPRVGSSLSLRKNSSVHLFSYLLSTYSKPGTVPVAVNLFSSEQNSKNLCPDMIYTVLLVQQRGLTRS